MRHRRLTILPAAGLALLAGCASGDLAMHLLVTSEMRSRDYRLEPEGLLTVTEGAGLIEGRRDRPAFETRLDPAAMRQMKQAVADSGFFFQDSPMRGEFSGPLIRMEVKLGLWHNVVQTRGQPVTGVGRIIAHMNRHLPVEYQLIYEPPVTDRMRQELDRPFW